MNKINYYIHLLLKNHNIYFISLLVIFISLIPNSNTTECLASGETSGAFNTTGDVSSLPTYHVDNGHYDPVCLGYLFDCMLKHPRLFAVCFFGGQAILF